MGYNDFFVKLAPVSYNGSLLGLFGNDGLDLIEADVPLLDDAADRSVVEIS